MKLLKKSIGVFGVVLIVLGVKFWNKSSSYNDIKAQMFDFCEGAAQCETVLNKHFDSCFDNNYDMGSKSHSGGLNQSGFVQCINSHAGSDLLTLNH